MRSPYTPRATHCALRTARYALRTAYALRAARCAPRTRVAAPLQERKTKIEVFKLKQEDRRWAEQHGLSGERGAFQGMIARYRLGQPAQPACALPPPPRVSDSRLSVFVRCRPS